MASTQLAEPSRLAEIVEEAGRLQARAAERMLCDASGVVWCMPYRFSAGAERTASEESRREGVWSWEGGCGVVCSEVEAETEEECWVSWDMEARERGDSGEMSPYAITSALSWE